MRKYPELVCKLSFGCNAWIVGSGATLDTEDPRDYDILIPFEDWKNAMLLIPKDAKVNAFGGWKCISEGKEIDVWPGSLSDFLLNDMVKQAYHHKSGVRIKKV